MIPWFLNPSAIVFGASLPNGNYLDRMGFTESKLNLVATKMDRKRGIKR